MALVECYRNRNIYLVTIFILLFEIFFWLVLLFYSRNFSIIFQWFNIVFFFFSLLFPFICTALFILNVKIKIWYHLKFEDIGMYMCYTCHVQIFFVFFIQTLCRYLLISFFFYRNFYSSFSHCYEFKLNKTGI